jgi:DNA/RNA endonuclease YhcR with UshA esterase domain
MSNLIFSQANLLNESFSNPEFPPSGWDTLRSDTIMGNWYRYNYTGASGPDSFQARLRVYDAVDTLRTGWSSLETPHLDLAVSPGDESLFFWYRFSQSSNNLGPDDTMFIDITNNDSTWSNIFKIAQGSDNNVWQIAGFDLSSYNTYNNARIRFYYEDRPNDSLNQWNCNFWLDSVKVVNTGGAIIMPISQAFEDLDSNYVPDHLNSIVTITGTVTAPPGIFSDIEAYIQDSTAGVNLFGDFAVPLELGDSIIITGTVDQYRGKSELTDFTYTVVQQNTQIPSPIDINADILNTEMYEGCLVRIKISYIDAFILEGNENYNAWDTLNIPFIVRIDTDTDIPGSIAPVDTFTLTGIKGQYTYSSPPDDGYQLMPRSVSDFSHLFEPVIFDIAEVQAVGNDGVTSKYVDSIVTVEGVITGPNYVFTAGSPSFYIQDSTAGVNIYNADGDGTYYDYIDSLGARIRVVGTVTEYNGLTEIANGYAWFLNMDTVPRPKELASNRFLCESMEGSLIEFQGIVQTPPYKTGDGFNIDVLNGDVGLTVRFTTATLINPTSILKNDERVFTGIVGQYDSEEPYTSGYQVLLRSENDINIPGFDSASAQPIMDISGPKTFIPDIGEQAEIMINAPVDHRLDLTVHDMNFRCVKTLYSGAGGPRTVYWDGKDDRSRPCKIGIYLLNLKSTASNGTSRSIRQLIVIGTR